MGLYLLSGLFITILLVVLTVLKFGPAPKAALQKDEQLPPEHHACNDVVPTTPYLRVVKDDNDDSVPRVIEDPPSAA